MKIEIGKCIKQLRQEKGSTQEELAHYLGVSYQAVSKWENDMTFPDIQLLPMLAMYFGVTIDEFFKLPTTMQLERIEAMLEQERIIKQETFNAIENELQEFIKENDHVGKASYLLAELYNHRIRNDQMLATQYAKLAIEKKPYERKYHHSLLWAANGVKGDRIYNTHHELIDYYRTFTSKHPDYWHAYMYLLDQLLGDGEYDEATKVLEQVKKVEHTSLDYIYEGDIAYGLGDKEKARILWDKSIAVFPSEWAGYFLHGDRMMKIGHDNEAMKDYEKCMELQTKPRLVDALELIAFIYEKQNNIPKAIEAIEREINIIEEEHGITQGEEIEKPRRMLKRLQQML